MKLDLNSIDGRWFQFEDTDVELLIKPYPTRKGLENKDESKIKDIYDHCLAGWKNIYDADGKEIKFNEENKDKIFDYMKPFLSFISEKVLTFDIVIQEELKN
jgi:hypothetical protein